MIDHVDAESLIHGLLETAKGIRAGFKYSEDEKMVPTAIILAADDTVIAPLHFRNNAEKYGMMRAVGNRARTMKAEAIAVASDVRFATSESICKVFGIERFREEYHRILRTKYQGELKLAPREVWTEAVCCFIKGPMIGVHCKLAHYIEGPGDRVQFVPNPKVKEMEDSDGYRAECEMIPDWWK